MAEREMDVPNTCPAPREMILWRLHVLRRMAAVLKECSSDEERSIAALRVHKEEFEDVHYNYDDNSEALMRLVEPLLSEKLREDVQLAEKWIRILRVYVMAPSEEDISALLLLNTKKMYKRKICKRGTGRDRQKEKENNIRVPGKDPQEILVVVETGQVADRYLCLKTQKRGVTEELTDSFLDLQKLRCLSGWQGTRIENLLQPRRPYYQEVVTHFSRVPHLLKEHMCILRDGMAHVRLEDIWAIRVTRNIEICLQDAEDMHTIFKNMRPIPKPRVRNSELPSIDKVEGISPPCIQSIIAQLKMTGHISNSERVPLFSYLFNLGYSEEEVVNLAETHWSPEKQQSLQRMRNNATYLFKKPYLHGCKKMGTLTFAGADGQLFNHCPIADIEDLQTACYGILESTHGSRRGKKKVFYPHGYPELVLQT